MTVVVLVAGVFASAVAVLTAVVLSISGYGSSCCCYNSCSCKNSRRSCCLCCLFVAILTIAVARVPGIDVRVSDVGNCCC